MAKSKSKALSASQLVALSCIAAYERCVAALGKVLDAESGLESVTFGLSVYDRNLGMIDAQRHAKDDSLMLQMPAVAGVNFVELPDDLAPIFEDCRRDLLAARKFVDTFVTAASQTGADTSKERQTAGGAVNCVKARAQMLTGYRTMVLGS